MRPIVHQPGTQVDWRPRSLAMMLIRDVRIEHTGERIGRRRIAKSALRAARPWADWTFARRGDRFAEYLRFADWEVVQSFPRLVARVDPATGKRIGSSQTTALGWRDLSKRPDWWHVER